MVSFSYVPERGALDWQTRKAKFIEKANGTVIEEALAKITTLVASQKT